MADPIGGNSVEQWSGVKCPNPDCGVVESYKGGQNKKTTDCITRHKICKVCGTVFKTMEVPIGVVTLKNKHKT